LLLLLVPRLVRLLLLQQERRPLSAEKLYVHVP
jgi:hypothetical protein